MNLKFVIPAISSCRHPGGGRGPLIKNNLDPGLRHAGMTAFFAGVTMLFSIAANAAVYCVGPNATGPYHDGRDWNNLKAWADTPVRGDTWYLRDGDYAFKTLNTANGNGALITIKKATVSNYTEASATGWNSSYAGQARISGLTIGSSYWVIDGVTGDGASVMPADINTSHYGFYMTPQTGVIRLTGALTNITLKHMRFFAPTTSRYGNAILQSDAREGDKNYLTISHCLFDGFNEVIRNGSDQWNNTVLECSIILNSEGHSDPSNPGGPDDDHGNPINAMWAPIVNMTIRDNIWKGANGNGISGIISANGSYLDGILVYGNVFDSIKPSGYVLGSNDSKPGIYISNSTFYHNTVISSAYNNNYPVCGRRQGTGNSGGNNLFYDGPWNYPYASNWTVIGSDAWSAVDNPQGPNQQIISGDPFVDRVNMDYRLKVNTQPGVILNSIYGQDPLGNPRTNRTRGAFEFVSGTPSFVYHPADVNPKDQKIDLNEATTFGACWKSNCNSNATLDNASRAGFLWKASATGQYQYNSANACPLCWEVKP